LWAERGGGDGACWFLTGGDDGCGVGGEVGEAKEIRRGKGGSDS